MERRRTGAGRGVVRCLRLVRGARYCEHEAHGCRQRDGAPAARGSEEPCRERGDRLCLYPTAPQ
jgi:hypothetical protein